MPTTLCHVTSYAANVTSDVNSDGVRYESDRIPLDYDYSLCQTIIIANGGLGRTPNGLQPGYNRTISNSEQINMSDYITPLTEIWGLKRVSVTSPTDLNRQL